MAQPVTDTGDELRAHHRKRIWEIIGRAARATFGTPSARRLRPAPEGDDDTHDDAR